MIYIILFWHWLHIYVTISSKISKTRKAFFFTIGYWNTYFFAVDILNCVIFCNWLRKYATASLKIGKIYAFFMTDFLKCAKFLLFSTLIFWNGWFLIKLVALTRIIFLKTDKSRKFFAIGCQNEHFYLSFLKDFLKCDLFHKYANSILWKSSKPMLYQDWCLNYMIYTLAYFQYSKVFTDDFWKICHFTGCCRNTYLFYS